MNNLIAFVHRKVCCPNLGQYFACEQTISAGIYRHHLSHISIFVIILLTNYRGNSWVACLLVCQNGGKRTQWAFNFHRILNHFSSHGGLRAMPGSLVWYFKHAVSYGDLCLLVCVSVWDTCTLGGTYMQTQWHTHSRVYHTYTHSCVRAHTH